MFLTWGYSTLTLTLTALITAACFISCPNHTMHNDCWWKKPASTNIYHLILSCACCHQHLHIYHSSGWLSHPTEGSSKYLYPLLLIIETSSWENINIGNELAFLQFLQLSDTVRWHGSLQSQYVALTLIRFQYPVTNPVFICRGVATGRAR